jgi:predicted membrane protein
MNQLAVAEKLCIFDVAQFIDINSKRRDIWVEKYLLWLNCFKTFLSVYLQLRKWMQIMMESCLVKKISLAIALVFWCFLSNACPLFLSYSA